MRHVNTALIGFGYRGKQLLRLMRAIDTFNVVGVADRSAASADDALSCGVAFYGGETGYVDMIDERRPDLVFITTPWHLHVPQAADCLRRHCHVALEIKGGLARGEYAPLMALAESGGLKVYPLENTLFLREILAVKRMADEGVFGDIVYMRGGYRHDLRDILVDEKGRLGGRAGTESVWRSRFYTRCNGDIYPTHGLAPLCMILGVGRSDRLAWLTSFASKAVGLASHIRELTGATPPHITLGDVVSTQIETAGGTLISLTHDTTLPRPRSLDFEVEGTRGVWDGVNRRIYVEGLCNGEEWADDSALVGKYESRYWQLWGADALVHDHHHNGMDYIMLRALAADMLGDMDYPATLADLALWTSVSVLSEQSIREHRRMAFD